MKLSACILATLLALAPVASASDAQTAARAIDTGDVLAHIKRLASDEFEGRSPGTKGEELTVAYLTDQFKKLGLKPGNPDGTYVQKVPLVGYTIDQSARLDLSAGEKALSLNFGDDYVAWTRRLVPAVSMDADMVFVGYGAVAPEYGWNDFKDVDVKGKVVVMLINDPPLPDMFGGKAMTYYGRWTYKYEIAAEKGAAGCIIVHETEPAAYPWAVVRNGRDGEQFTIGGADNNMSLCPVEGWVTVERARELFALGGKDFAEAKQAALSRDFRPISLGVRAKLALKNTMRRVDSKNVIAKIEGSDPKLKNEYLVYTAHWDHFGIGTPVNGDAIYNGAVDNATGTAGLLAVARAYRKLPKPPRRSVLFLAVTAEERGLLGSAYYGENPLYPLAKTVAVINTDSMNVRGRTRDITVIGLGNSSLDDEVKKAATAQGRVANPDPQPEKGSFYRSDHFSFAKQGVPSLYVSPGIEFVGKPATYGIDERKRYTADDYHKPSDEVRPDWDLGGMVEDLQLIFHVGLAVANADRMPEWREGNEFKAKRDATMKAGSR